MGGQYQALGIYEPGLFNSSSSFWIGGNSAASTYFGYSSR